MKQKLLPIEKIERNFGIWLNILLGCMFIIIGVAIVFILCILFGVILI